MASYLFRSPSIADDLQQVASDIDRTLLALQQLDYIPVDTADAQTTAILQAQEDAHNDHLRYLLRAAIVRIQVYADALNIMQLQHIIAEWRAKWPEESWGKTKHWSTPEADGIYSPPFSELRHALDAMTVIARPVETSPPDLERRGFQQLEHALRSMAKVCRERGVTVEKESDLQAVVHSQLEFTFADYVRNVQISKPIVNFKPDGGVRSLKAVIECKVIKSEDSLKVAIHGLTEDLSGYSGSSDWTKFYTLCYMTDAFAVEGHLTSALRSSGNADGWTVILVTAGRPGKQM